MSNISAFYTTDNNYSIKSDEQLIALIKSGDKIAIDFLIEKYKDLVNKKVGKYFMIGAEIDFIIQEGMIGLFIAIQSFDSTKHY